MLLDSEALATADTDVLTLGELRRQFANAYTPIPRLYWRDLLLSSCLGWGAFLIGALTPFLSFVYVVATLIAVVALLRATVFIHELSHLKRGSVPGFESVWNLLIGIPLLLPSLMYDSHGAHHRQITFATAHDPEYGPIAHWNTLRTLWFVGSTVFVPFLLALRWGVLGPLSFLLPPLRRLLIARASSLVINAQYERPRPRPNERLRWYVQETSAALAFWTAVVVVLGGTLPLYWLAHWYVVGAGVAVVNQVRTLAAHRYQNDGRQLTSVEQLLDSINLTGPPFLTVLAAPVGLRYHALHHFLPTVPYHSLGGLHRRLLAELAPDSLYHQTAERGILAAVQRLVRRRTEYSSSALLSADRRAAEV